MGVIAVGIGAGNRLALIGAALHVVAHAIVKSVAFLAAIPLLAPSPTPTATHRPASPARGPGWARCWRSAWWRSRDCRRRPCSRRSS